MNFIGGIEGMNFSPISGYNNYLKNTMAFDVAGGADFENVLSAQTANLQQSPHKLSGGVEVNMNFDNIMAQNTSNSEKDYSAGSLIKSISGAVGGGLDSVNNANIAAERAQEALAMGEDISVHDVMIAAEKSSLGMQMAMQLRNKMMAAYNEINNVRV